jgi:hypothetical protein
MFKHELRGQKFSTDTEVKQTTAGALCKTSGNGLLHVWEVGGALHVNGVTSKKKQYPSLTNPQIVSNVSSAITYEYPLYKITWNNVRHGTEFWASWIPVLTISVAVP